MCHEVKCSDAMANGLHLTHGSQGSHTLTGTATHLTARVMVLARARAKSRLELAVPVHLVRMKIAHRGALSARLGRTSTLSIGAHLALSLDAPPPRAEAAPLRAPPQGSRPRRCVAATEEVVERPESAYTRSHVAKLRQG